MHPDLEELLNLIACRLSVDEVLDILDWELYELLEALKPHINDNYSEFLKAVR
jgi:hypothetical protein